MTFLITVTPATVTGTVQVLDGTTVLGSVTLASGSAQFTTSSLAQGAHSITGVYGGNASNAGSTSTVLSQAVKLNPAMVLNLNPNPAFLGQTVTISAGVNTAATGTVQFADGSLVLATVPVSAGSAVYTTSTLSQGTLQITATYSGDANYLSVQSATTPVTFLASVIPATATGNVQFLDGTTLLGTIALTNGTAQLSFSTLAQGSHAITAVYAGDVADAGSTSAVLTQVAKLSAGMTAGLNPSPLVVGQTLTISAQMATALPEQSRSPTMARLWRW